MKMGPSEGDTSIDERETSLTDIMVGLHSDSSEKIEETFDLLPGETYSGTGQIVDGKIGISNYRIKIEINDCSSIIPLGVIEMLEQKDGCLSIICKDAKTYRCKFRYLDDSIRWVSLITNTALQPQLDIHNIFAHKFYEACKEENLELFTALETESESYESIFENEMKRLDFDLAYWKVSNVNQDLKICPSYPKQLIVPVCINDSIIEASAKFRGAHRMPAVVWRHSNGAVIARCSQPEVGWFGWRSAEDEELIQAISDACAAKESTTRNRTTSESNGSFHSESFAVVSAKKPKKCLIVDARSYHVALANRARGGGVECSEYYTGCDIQFMNLGNIHLIRKSHILLRQLFANRDTSSSSSWLSNLDYSKWLQHISGLIRSGCHVAKTIACEARPVLVHCSDGWDRTPQITSLAQLLLDPYYRTINGFKVLIEREWIQFGHKFRDRCGTGTSMSLPSVTDERSPIFLQWLECVHHVILQFPTAFQFNETFLIKLAQHIYSNQFSTFLFNSNMERESTAVSEEMFSVWSFFRINKHKYINYLYNQTTATLYPSYLPQDLYIWKGYYDMERNIFTDLTADQEEHENEEFDEDPGMSKARSCDNLMSLASVEVSSITRRSSDPNLCKTSPVALTPTRPTHEPTSSLASSTQNCSVLAGAEDLENDHFDVPDADENSQSFVAKDLPLSMSQELASLTVEDKKDRKQDCKSQDDVESGSNVAKCSCSSTVEFGVDVARFLGPSSSGPRASSPSTPGHSRSSSSGIPSTPTEDRYATASEKTFGLPSVDGLRAPIEDEATKRIQQMITNYQNQVELLRRNLRYTKDCHQNLLNKNQINSHENFHEIDQLEPCLSGKHCRPGMRELGPYLGCTGEGRSPTNLVGA